MLVQPFTILDSNSEVWLPRPYCKLSGKGRSLVGEVGNLEDAGM